jgi:hypothetical protein
MGRVMNHRQLKAPARRADRASDGERKRLVEKLIRKLPKLDPFEGCEWRKGIKKTSRY